jgi:hypothetical protein
VSFSLKYLFVVVALAAIFAGAFVYRTPLWASLVVTATFGLLIIATVYSVLVTSSRHFSLGFIVTGWLYLAVVFIPFLSEAHRVLFTTRLLGYGWERLKGGQLHPEFVLIGGVRFPELDKRLAVDAAVEPFQSAKQDYYMELRSFFYIGDCCSALLLALLTGVIASYCVRRSKTAEYQK